MLGEFPQQHMVKILQAAKSILNEDESNYQQIIDSVNPEQVLQFASVAIGCFISALESYAALGKYDINELLEFYIKSISSTFN
jgi:hypothetical protein